MFPIVHKPVTKPLFFYALYVKIQPNDTSIIVIVNTHIILYKVAISLKNFYCFISIFTVYAIIKPIFVSTKTAKKAEAGSNIYHLQFNTFFIQILYLFAPKTSPRNTSKEIT